MTNNQKITEEAQLRDSKGWLYRGEEHEPSYSLPAIMEFCYTMNFEENLDFDDWRRLAAYITAVDNWAVLNPETLETLWSECQENYQGSFATEAEFAESFLTEIGEVDEDATKNLVIDWEATYNYSLRYDYFNVYVYAQNENTNAVLVDRYFFRSC